jgi:hypothetical protein
VQKNDSDIMEAGKLVWAKMLMIDTKGVSLERIQERPRAA